MSRQINDSELNWVSAMRASLPTSLSDLLLDPGSMTVRLRALCDDDFSVQLLSHDWQSVSAAEYQLLDIDTRVLLREVILSGTQQPWMFARVVIPEEVVTAFGDELLQLGTRPLGEVLFQQQNIARTEFEIAQVPTDHALVSHLDTSIFEDHVLLWARRSMLQLAAGDIFLTEVALPALTKRVEMAAGV